MSRSHFIEETIVDTLFRGDLITFLKKQKKLPDDWDCCSIQVSQESPSDDIKFIVKRTSSVLGQ